MTLDKHPGTIRFVKVTVDVAGETLTSSWIKSAAEVPAGAAFFSGQPVVEVVAEVTPDQRMTLRHYGLGGKLLGTTLGSKAPKSRH